MVSPVVPISILRSLRLTAWSLSALLVGMAACGEPAADDATSQQPPGNPPPQQMQPGDPDCPPSTVCDDIPAAYVLRDVMTGGYGNYDLANRPFDRQEIRYIVIHTTEVSWDGTIKIFQNPAASASAHYLVRSSDGRIARFVSPVHVAWHAGNWYMNSHSVGIEHEANSFEGNKWFTDAMYASSAKLVRHLARRFGVPLDRAHIIGHDEVPGISQARQKAMHWDPGLYWDWDRYMQLLQAEDGVPTALQSSVDKGAADTAILIAPKFAQNPQPASYCYGPNQASDCRDAPVQPANFLYLRTAPDATAPLLPNPFLTVWPGDRMYNWGNKLSTGHTYVRAERSGDWDAIYFSGQKAWFYNPGLMHTRAALPQQVTMVTPRAGLATVPVYGVSYPVLAGSYQAPSKPQTFEKIYDIAAGQKYVVTSRHTADYYWAKVYAKTLAEASHTVVREGTEYFQIEFNHRVAFVRTSDVDLLP